MQKLPTRKPRNPFQVRRPTLKPMPKARPSSNQVGRSTS
jgi:hypothetical protein